MMKKKLVVLTGAGISAESGLKTFRDSDGLWNGYNIEDVATPRAWKKNKQLVLDFYNMRRQDVLKAEPNAAHVGLAELENDFDVHVITQNIDDLHERAGSTKVLHLHGEIFKMRSEKNNELVYEIRKDILLGDTAEDGAQLRPHIVWFEEPVPYDRKSRCGCVESGDLCGYRYFAGCLPGRGLVNYAPWHIPKFIIDRTIPYASLYNVTPIEKPATEGITELRKMLKDLTGSS
jgi:NAD-dependent deacetylase